MKKNILIFCILVLVVSALMACGAPVETSKPPTTSAPANPTTVPATTTSAPATTALPARPEGEVVVAIPDFGNENFIPWQASMGSSPLGMVVYDMLIYWDYINFKYIPGLAESWEVSPDALTLTYRLRKGVQFQDGWGELTSADIKYNFEMHASPRSIGKTTATRNIASMDTPDPYTLVVHFKKPAPTFFTQLSWGDGGICQGIVCKKYVETVGEEVAGEKPIGSGPYKLVESKPGSYMKFEALDSHWRVVPEFKYLTVRSVTEISTKVAMLKTKEIDMAKVSGEQLADLKASGLATEANPVGGGILSVSWGGMILPADSRYNPDYHNKDPWVDARVRKAMAVSIDRDAINKTIFNGTAVPVGVPVHGPGIEKYQYPYNPAEAKQALAEAGYPNGFSFEAVSYTLPPVLESTRVMEALAGYWQQIGLDPKITVIDYNRYNSLRSSAKTAGGVSLFSLPVAADMLDKTAWHFIPGCTSPMYMDEGSAAIWNEGNAKANAEERAAYIDKLNQYFYENYGPIPLAQVSTCYAWNPAKISQFPNTSLTSPLFLEYIRHAQPLNTFRLFTPFPGR